MLKWANIHFGAGNQLQYTVIKNENLQLLNDLHLLTLFGIAECSLQQPPHFFRDMFRAFLSDIKWAYQKEIVLIRRSAKELIFIRSMAVLHDRDAWTQNKWTGTLREEVLYQRNDLSEMELFICKTCSADVISEEACVIGNIAEFARKDQMTPEVHFHTNIFFQECQRLVTVDDRIYRLSLMDMRHIDPVKFGHLSQDIVPYELTVLDDAVLDTPNPTHLLMCHGYCNKNDFLFTRNQAIQWSELNRSTHSSGTQGVTVLFSAAQEQSQTIQ